MCAALWTTVGVEDLELIYCLLTHSPVTAMIKSGC